ncbi:hypothetical protein BG011_001315, partial [Mortierella polycephala]
MQKLGISSNPCSMHSPTGIWGLNPNACSSRTLQAPGDQFQTPAPTSRAGVGDQFQPLLPPKPSMNLGIKSKYLPPPESGRYLAAKPKYQFLSNPTDI